MSNTAASDLAAKSKNEELNSRDKKQVNRDHKVYRKTERKFRKIICLKMRKRRFDVRANEIYNEANITKPTFYSHFNNSAHARYVYETELTKELFKLLPIHANRSEVFEVLMIYILKNRQYFLAAHKGCDHYLLTQIIKHYRINLAGRRINDQTFYVYSVNIQAAIGRWLEFDKLNQETALAVAKKLSYMNIMRV